MIFLQYLLQAFNMIKLGISFSVFNKNDLPIYFLVPTFIFYI